ncbi:MAG: hypothetical protein ACTSP5_11275, partial [Candidatus Heimdallarchaeota archaeon]
MAKSILEYSYANGLLVKFPDEKKLIVDSTNVRVPPKIDAIVTHAHSDHFAVMNSITSTYSTQETIDLFLSQKKKKPDAKLVPVNFNEKIAFQNGLSKADVRLVPSGHILGSASVIIESEDDKLLFSSDIGGKGQLTVKDQLSKIDANTLIIEATFGSPDIIFPSREETSMEIIKWSADVIKQKMNVIFNAGRIGSAQELIKLFNNMTNLRVVTHAEVTALSEIYQKYGVKLDFVDSKSEEGKEILKDGEAVIIQPRGKKIIPYHLTEHIQCKNAIVTGMASRFQYKNFDASFPLSSHANYLEIIEYISAVNPEKVYTIYGLEDKLADA